MFDLVSRLATIESQLMESLNQAKEEEREAAEEERRLDEHLQIVRAAKAEAQALGSSHEQFRGSVPAILETIAGITDTPNEGHGFLRPAQNPQNAEPIYDPRVLSGYDSYRARAQAAARVYGRVLREKSLAEAIFETGETNATDAVSARTSLGSIARYGNDWVRRKGWLYYRGDLTCDVDTVKSLLSGTGDGTHQGNDG